ncbi:MULTISPECIES: alpha/beta hydrolase [unclassified Leucobacter]|uniref:alpha/beta hydrolase n=1 Tax=unclassified Leucobacter TaxID=2621730 RepID=UPI0030180294
MRNRTTAAFALLALGGLGLSACSPAVDDSASARQAESFPGVYAQSIEWGECDLSEIEDRAAKRLEERGAPLDEYECALVEAPLDWNDPSNHETIELSVNRRAATGDGEPIGTLFVNPGGPGGSGVDLAYRVSVMNGAEPVTERYDVVGFDPRGIGRSSAIDSPGFSSVRELEIALCADANPLAHSMGTSQVARDMELLRALVDDEKAHYLGYSYGTVLGATYATLFPERVGRMVLDSAIAARWASPQQTFAQQAATAHEVVELLSTCATEYAQADCPIDSEEALRQAMQRLAEAPLVASDGSEIDGGLLFSYLASSLYGIPETRDLALETLAGAMRGEQQSIDGIVESMANGGAAVGPQGLIVRCHSFPADPDLVGFVEYVEEAGIPELLGGPEVNDESLGPWVDLSCDALPESGDDITESFSGSPDAPILVVGVTGDHATPYEGSQQLVRELGNARLLTLDGHGHGASFAERSSCVNDATVAYLLTGELPAEGTVCKTD